MNEMDLKYHIENLCNMEPDYVVDVLGITTEDLIEKFYGKAIVHIEEEYGVPYEWE